MFFTHQFFSLFVASTSTVENVQSNNLDEPSEVPDSVQTTNEFDTGSVFLGSGGKLFSFKYKYVI